MANGDTTADLVRSVLRNCGELQDGTSPYHDDALEYLDRFHKAFHEGSTLFDIDFGGVWPWAKEDHPNIIVLEPAYTTGTISLTKGSATGAFSSGPAASLENWFIQVDSRPEIFRIDSHVAAATAFTLDSEYTDDTGSGLSFKAFKLDYLLNQVEGQKITRLVTPLTIYRDQSSDMTDTDTGLIYGMEYLQFKKKFPLKWVQEGIPTRFAEIRDDDGLKTLRFNRYPNTETRIEYEFVQRPNALQDSDDSVPRLPYTGRSAIEYAATYKLMLDTDDDRAEKYLALCQAQLKAVSTADRVQAAQSSVDRGRLIARPDLYSSNSRRIRRDDYQ